MSSRRWILALAVAALVGCAGGAGGAGRRPPPDPVTHGILAGMIRTADTGAPVTDAVIVLRRPGELAPTQEHTTSTGAYMVGRLAPGAYQVKVYRDERTVGDETVSISAGRVTGLDVQVGAAPAPLDDAVRDVASGTPLWRFRPTDADPRVGAIEGTVSEQGGRTRLAGAVVTVTDADGGMVADAVSDDRGVFHIPDLRPGVYLVSAFYALVGRGQFEIRRGGVTITGGETVVVPLAIETSE